MRTTPYEGQIVWIQGYEFHVHNIRIMANPDGRDVVRFQACCTSHPANAPIRGTEYDGAVYGHAVGERFYADPPTEQGGAA
jgi:hypothetical protein